MRSTATLVAAIAAAILASASAAWAYWPGQGSGTYALTAGSWGLIVTSVVPGGSGGNATLTISGSANITSYYSSSGGTPRDALVYICATGPVCGSSNDITNDDRSVNGSTGAWSWTTGDLGSSGNTVYITVYQENDDDDFASYQYGAVTLATTPLPLAITARSASNSSSSGNDSISASGTAPGGAGNVTVQLCVNTSTTLGSCTNWAFSWTATVSPTEGTWSTGTRNGNFATADGQIAHFRAVQGASTSAEVTQSFS